MSRRRSATSHFAEALTPRGGSDPPTSDPRVDTGVKSCDDGFGVLARTLADASLVMIGWNLYPDRNSPRSFCKNASTVAAECTQLRVPDSAKPGPPVAPRAPSG